MKNPWLRKNPVMSMWLSGANAMVGAARARASAEAKRQTATMMTQGTKQMMDLWAGAALSTLAPRKKRKKSR
jgi:hypothetical protein